MTVRSLPKRARPLVWFLLSLTLLLSLGAAATIAYQRYLIKDELTKHLQREIDLFGNVVQAALRTHNYAAAQRDLDDFCRDHEEIAAVRLMAPDGRALARCGGPSDAGTIVHLARSVTYGDAQLVTLDVDLDLAPARDHFRRLIVTMGSASLLFTVCMGFLLWRVLKRTAFQPLEQAVAELSRTKEHLELRVAERTAAWMLSNKELKEEIVERLAVEQELMIKERAIASSISGIALADFDGKVTYVNDAFLALWRFGRPDEVVGRHASEFWQSPERAAAIMREVRERGVWIGELAAKRGDGTLFDALLTADVVLDSNDAPICLMASFVDVTGRKLVEAALQKQKDFTDAVLDVIGAITVVLDREGKIIRFNRECERVSQYTAAEAVGRFVWDLVIPPEQVGQIKEVFAKLAAGRFPSRHENTWMARDGSQRLISWSNTCITGENGDVEFVIATGIDITQSRAAEEALRASEQRLRSITEAVSDVIYRRRPDGTITYASPSVRHVLGYAPEEVVGMNFRDFAYPEDRERAVENDRRLREGRAVKDEALRVLRKSGEAIQAEVTLVPLRNADGVFEVQGVLRDVTERKATEAALKAAVVRAEEEKNKSAAVIAAIGDAISIQGRDFKVLYQNEKHKSLIGNHVGEYCYEAYEKQTAVCDGCPVALSFADGRVHTAERSGRTDDGRQILVEVTTSPLLDASGEMIAGIEVVRDISGRKQMEQDLRLALETQSVISSLLRIPTAGSPLADVMREALGVVLKSSLYSFHSIGGIFLLREGTGRLELIAQQGFSEFIREACREVAVGACLCGRAAMSGEIEFASDLDERHEIRYPGISPHGHYCVPIVQGSSTVGVLALYLDQGHRRDDREEEFLRSVASALSVIIQRKRMEEDREALIGDLRRLVDVVSLSQQEWRGTFDGINDPIIVIGADRNVRKANRAFAALFGLRPQEVINRDCLELLYRGQTPPGDDPILRGLREAGSAEGEVSDPASQRVYRVSVFPVTSSEKELPGAIVVLRDVTEERDREMRLIMNERLASLGQMASGIAHEINNPLAAIAGCVDGMTRRISRDQFEPELFLRYLRIIKDEITRSKNITTSMLSIVRKSSYERKQIDIRATIDSSLEIIGYQGRLRMVEVQKNVPEDIPPVLGSEGEVRQVLLILITNALDAMQDHGLLRVAASFDAREVMIDVGDCGHGIPAELQQRIFDPFFSSKADKGGTGLGLSIAQRIVEGHNGSLRILASDSSGTIFRVSLSR